MNLNTPTFRRLLDSELARTGSPDRAFSRAMVAYGFLHAIAQEDGFGVTWGTSPEAVPRTKHGGFARANFFRYKAALRQAGVAPLRTPAELAALAQDLSVRDRASLARLLWALNTSRRSSSREKRSLAGVLEGQERTIASAQRLIEEAEREWLEELHAYWDSVEDEGTPAAPDAARKPSAAGPAALTETTAEDDRTPRPWALRLVRKAAALDELPPRSVQRAHRWNPTDRPA